MASSTFAALRVKHVRPFAAGRLLGELAAQMKAVTVGWMLYERTNSALALGLQGIIELIPVLILALPAGHVADRFRRRDVAMISQLGVALCALGLAFVTYRDAPIVWVYVILFFNGIGEAFRQPATGSILPTLVPPEHFINANAWFSSAFELASMGGPAVGGLLIALTHSATLAFVAAGASGVAFALVLGTLPKTAPSLTPKVTRLADLLGGLKFVLATRVFLAAITLDLFAVLLGGATALLPIFAKDILHVGPTGLGWLRAAPSMGAFTMAMMTTRLRPWKKPGVVLLWTVAGFGVATVGFGLSHSFPLSMLLLFATGVFDNISVVIRRTLEQLLTPDAMRGRVSAINYVFIGLSNELGSFESGTTAAILGPILSVVGGGVGTLLVVVIVALAWPEMRKLAPLSTLSPLEPGKDGDPPGSALNAGT